MVIVLNNKGLEREKALVISNRRTYVGTEHADIIRDNNLSGEIFTLDLMTDNVDSYVIAHSTAALYAIDDLRDISDICFSSLCIYINLSKGDFIIVETDNN